MTYLSSLISYLVPFLVVLTILVFVHELGHYLVARRNRVRIEVFSIGFGPELFGFNDRAGTRWKFSAIPLGGYVKMFGDENAASAPGSGLPGMTLDEKAVSFHHKTVGQRAAIVAAGPIANFLFAVVVLTALFATVPHPFPPAVVGGVQPGSPAERAGLQPGDEIISVDGHPVHRFMELPALLSAGDGRPVAIELDRDGRTVDLAVAPEPAEEAAGDGATERVYRIGITPESGPVGLGRAVRMGVSETVDLCWATFVAIGEMIGGSREAQDMVAGPLRIAQLSGTVAQFGPAALVWFMAILSVNLGLINLFPVPVLDGGHLMFYAIEAARGRPLGRRAQEFGFRIGLALVLTLMLFATWNDLVHLRLVSFLKGLIS